MESVVSALESGAVCQRSASADGAAARPPLPYDTLRPLNADMARLYSSPAAAGGRQCPLNMCETQLNATAVQSRRLPSTDNEMQLSTTSYFTIDSGSRF